MRLSVFQLDAGLGDVAARRAAIARHVAEAASTGAAIALFPELALTGYGDAQAVSDAALDAGALAQDPLQSLADAHGIAVAVGLSTREGGRCLNSAAVFRPHADPVLYHKRQLYGRYEKGLFEAGDAPSQIVEIGGLKVGLLVCFDVEFPEYVRDLALRGADLVLVPTALPFMEGSRFIAEAMIPVRAFESQVFVAYSGHAGGDGRFVYHGLSTIAAPDGSVLAKAGETGSAHLTADIDPSAFAASRRRNPYLEVAAGFRSTQ